MNDSEYDIDNDTNDDNSDVILFSYLYTGLKLTSVLSTVFYLLRKFCINQGTSLSPLQCCELSKPNRASVQLCIGQIAGSVDTTAFN